MAKALLEYHLPDELHEFELAVQADKLFALLWDVRHLLIRMQNGKEVADYYEVLRLVNDRLKEEGLDDLFD